MGVIDVAKSGISPWKAFPADPASWFSAEEVARAKSYVKPLRRLGLVEKLLGLVVGVLLVWFKVGPRLLHGHVHNWFLGLFELIALSTLLSLATSTPFSWHRELNYDKRWGFSNQTPKQFMSDLVKGLLVGLILNTLIFTGIWALIRSTSLWWIWGWVGAVVFSVVLNLLAPVLLDPLFNKFKRLDDDELHDELVSMARSVDADVSEVQVSDASKRDTRDNAYVTGMGATRRLVIFDTMLTRPREQLRSVAAHEIGHWKLRHIMAKIPLVTGLLLVNFGVLRIVLGWHALLKFAGVGNTGLRDPAAYFLFALVFPLPTVATSMVIAWHSRGCERQADLFALEATQDAPAASAIERALHVDNLADLAPSLWRRLNASHPPAAERLAMIEAWSQRQAAG